ncbi:hypothetical protein PQX77_017025, partial [Marasmius sp. AFHP31]
MSSGQAGSGGTTVEPPSPNTNNPQQMNIDLPASPTPHRRRTRPVSAPPEDHQHGRQTTPFDVLRIDDHRRRRRYHQDGDSPLTTLSSSSSSSSSASGNGNADPPPPPSVGSSQQVSDLLSVLPHAQSDYSMSLSDVNKAFADVGKLTGPDTWPMWKFRVNNAMNTILAYHNLRGGMTVPTEVTRAVFNVVSGHIVDSVMVNYLNEHKPHKLMELLTECFDPKTTVSDANEVYQLFQLRRPIYEIDKLLDDAQNLAGKIIAGGTELPDHIFYSAIVGMIPPAYNSTRSNYEAAVRATTKSGEKVVYKPLALIAELRREFNNWRITHPKVHKKSEGTTTLVPQSSSKDKLVDRSTKSTTTARAAVAPYSKDAVDRSKTKCYNCNKLGHSMPTCPKPWTESSKAAMKKKGITRKSVAAAAKDKGKAKAAVAVASTGSTEASANIASTTSGTSQSAWIASLSDSDVVMH